ncbi:hypothetical protein JOQ06_008690, partial [Pogonophryne albipinna]
RSSAQRTASRLDLRCSPDIRGKPNITRTYLDHPSSPVFTRLTPPVLSMLRVLFHDTFKSIPEWLAAGLGPPSP